ncbi:ABC transporter permease [Microbacterium sp. SORGH_AS_0888]|uniref:ABC transporter permease n=1 Tax=Microbacterium sp. SORGH_AS_0888 TaxID=3041791 RepID=UPI0027872EFD|nr:ABC transporter permease [Microbacterium sp. SORGH_AS_0888]MDQ1128475.1 ribose transport system permease protein [Microbacterium sp. SORGH_AS_0888]
MTQAVQTARATVRLAGADGTVVRFLAPATVVLIVIVFATLAPGYLAPGNLLSVASASAILFMAATAMTIVVRAGGIDLSVGVAIDLAALASASLISQGYVAWFALLGGLAFGLLVGVANAFLIVALRIRAFLATLSVWFIGTSVQQLLTDGGAPIALLRQRTPDAFAALGNASVAGITVPVLAAVLIGVGAWLLLDRTRWGRVLTAGGEQPTATRIAGRRTSASLASAYLLAALIAAFAGVVLASRSYGYSPAGGQLYVLDAIGAVFIGATLSRTGRPTVLGTAIGVLIFGLLNNGMVLVGLSFYWQGLLRGAVLLLLLLAAATLRRESLVPSLRFALRRGVRA